MGFDDKILALYAGGLTVRDIQAFLHEMYAVEVSLDLMGSRESPRRSTRSFPGRPSRRASCICCVTA